MENTTEVQVGNPAKPERPDALGLVARTLTSPQLGTLVALSAALAIGIGLIMWASKPMYAPVFPGATPADSAAIAETLRAQSVPFRVDPKTGSVLVPQDRIEAARLQLSASGLPGNNAVGLELLQQDQSLGTSQFMETARYQHALETELARTIAAMQNVDSARVHLALPRQSVFIRNRARASASVMVKPMPGRRLEDGQVEAMVNLVASSVAYLESGDVTIVDQWGRMLSNGGESVADGETRKQFDYARKLEELYISRIEALLEPLVGVGKVRARVTADVDFNSNEQTRELFDSDPAQIRSEQIHDQSSSQPPALGIPGALSNQPPGAGTTDAKAAAEGAGGETENVNRQSTRNYELDKTITHTRQAPGRVVRLSAAVIVDDRVTMAADGTAQRTPITDEEIERFTALAREAIGYDAARGDTVVVMNQAFQAIEEIEPPAALPLWEQPWFAQVLRQAVAALAILLLIFMVLRPAMKNLRASMQPALLRHGAGGVPGVSGGVEADELGDDVLNLSSPGQRPRALPDASKDYGEVLALARTVAAEDPRRVAKVVKNWVGEQEEENG
ncbi:MAG: flagellar M-ring protein FliF [Gammaproteobacteria bacterium]|nr:MAG: flagellar M-ring protein FliF [Gammaproteobacteria bacterium]